MGYFRELPNILYQSPLGHKTSSFDYINIKNIFRRSKLSSYLSGNVSMFNKYVIRDGDRPDTVADDIYGDPTLDYIVILTAGITNVQHEWPLMDFQIYDFALQKYGSESKMNEIHHYETLEIIDSENRRILPAKLKVDSNFKIDGSSLKFPSNRYTLVSPDGNRQLDDKSEFSVTVDNIAKPVTNYSFEIQKNEEKRNIDVLREIYVQQFINDLRDSVRYDKRASRVLSGQLSSTENTESIP
tara:strand:+ start:1631 stop:2356 length:726 start_codon:yes stop_codon:yes gene_type:complete